MENDGRPQTSTPAGVQSVTKTVTKTLVETSYQVMPFDHLTEMAENGDKEASRELARRHMEEDAKAARSVSAAGATVRRTGFNPDIRKPHLWIAFLFWLVWKKFGNLLEPLGISGLLYAIYRVAHGMYVNPHDWSGPIEQAGDYAFTLVLLLGLGSVANAWLQVAWHRRPVSIYIVIFIVVCWADGIGLI
jgi:hypothetical protein